MVTRRIAVAIVVVALTLIAEPSRGAPREKIVTLVDNATLVALHTYGPLIETKKYKYVSVFGRAPVGLNNAYCTCWFALEPCASFDDDVPKIEGFGVTIDRVHTFPGSLFPVLGPYMLCRVTIGGAGNEGVTVKVRLTK